MVNLIVFGALSRNSPGYSYLEGFWCAVVSVIVSGTIAVFLIFHCESIYYISQFFETINTQGSRHMIRNQERPIIQKFAFKVVIL
jgi:hypothetical protein